MKYDQFFINGLSPGPAPIKYLVEKWQAPTLTVTLSHVENQVFNSDRLYDRQQTNGYDSYSRYN